MAVGTFTFTVAAADAGWAGTGATRVLSITVGARGIVLYAADATRIAGTWSLVADASAAGGARVWNKDAAAPKLPAALANPANYFELTFQAEAGVAYHLWLRGKADKNAWANDSVYVQFSGASTRAARPSTGSARPALRRSASKTARTPAWLAGVGGTIPTWTRRPDVLRGQRPADHPHPGA